MTSPYQPMQINQGPVIQDPGIGGTIQQGLAGVLAQMQISKENQFRQQELQNAQAQQQALQQYYQAQAEQQQQELGMKAGEQAIMREGQQQVGAAQRAAMTGGQGLFSQILQGGAQATPPQSSLPSIFTGVSNENMPDAVKAVGQAQALMPQAPELPASAKEFMFVQHLNQLDPSGRSGKAFIDNWVKKAPMIGQINTGNKVETAYGVEGAKADVATRTEVLKSASASAAAFPAMNEAYQTLKKGNVIAGLGSNPMLQMNRILGAMGVNTSREKVRDTQTASRLLYEGVAAQLQKRTFGSGTAVSENDRKAAEGMAGVDFSKDPVALKRIVRINVGLNVESIVGAKALLQQQQQQYPESAKILQVQINALEKQLKPIWTSYLGMLEDEKKMQQLGPAQVTDSLFPWQRKH